jgi:replication factor A1
MKVEDLQPRKPVESITVEVLEVGEAREFSNPRGSGKVATARAKDDTGEISLTLWNDDIDKVKAGSKVTIENGWVSEWQGEKQLSSGRYGTLKIEK